MGHALGILAGLLGPGSQPPAVAAPGLGALVEFGNLGTARPAARPDGRIAVAFGSESKPPIYLLGDTGWGETSIPEYRILLPGPTFRTFPPGLSFGANQGVLAFVDFEASVGGDADEFGIGFHLLDAVGKSTRLEPFAAALNAWNSDIAFVRASMNAVGEFGLVYFQDDDDRVSRCIARLYQADGRPRSPQFQASDPGEFAREGQIASAPDGRALVVWESARLLEGWYQGWDIRARWFGPTGLPIGPSVTLNTRRGVRHGNPALAMASDGSFAVAWNQSKSAANGVYVRRFGPDGTPFGDEIRVSPNYPGAIEDYHSPRWTSDPDVALDATGRCVVVWNRVSPSIRNLPNQGIFAQRFLPSGARYGPVIRVDPVAPAGLATHLPAVAFTTNGTFLATWRDVNHPEPGIHLHGVARGRWIPWNAQAEVGPDHGPIVQWMAPIGETRGPVSVVELEFDRPMRPETLTAAPLAFHDPDGRLVGFTNIAFEMNQRVRMGFPFRSQPGTYHLTVGAGVKDAAGTGLSSDGNTQPGETTDVFRDAFTIPVTTPARLPFAEGFEGGPGTRPHWQFSAFAPGDLVVVRTNTARSGAQHLAFSTRSTPSGSAHAATLLLDLRPQARATNLVLGFWKAWRVLSFSCEFRIEIGNDPARLVLLHQETATASRAYVRQEFDLDEACRRQGISLDDPLYIRFSAGTHPSDLAAGSNLYLDDIEVTGGPLVVTARRVGSEIHVEWTDGFLESATSVQGPWTLVPGASVPPHRFSDQAGSAFLRARR